MFETSDEILYHSKFIRQKEYWIDKLSSYTPGNGRLFFSKEKPGAPTGMEKIEIPITGKLFASLMKLSKESDLSIYIVFLTVLKILFYRYTGNEDIIVVSPVYQLTASGETINDLLFIRDELHGNTTFLDLLLKVRQSVLEAYDNQDYPCDKLIEYLYNTGEEQRRRPLSNIVCLLQNIHDNEDFADVKDRLVFSFKKEENQVGGCILFDKNIYEIYYLQQAARHFIKLLENSLQDIKANIPAISFFSEEEINRLLFDFNSAGVEYAEEKLFHQRFEEQVEKTPDNRAVKYGNRELTYSRLNGRANRLAGVLASKGFQPGAIIGVMLDPSLEMVIGMMAVMKAGGTFLPLDPAYPEDRKAYIINDSKTPLLLTMESPAPGQSQPEPGTLNPADHHIYNYSGKDTNSKKVNTADDPVYMIYTSGTTGKPKGVLVKHKNLGNYVTWFAVKTHLSPTDKTVLTSSFAFDLGYTSIFTSITHGGELHLVSKDIYLSPGDLLNYIKGNGITYLKLTPSLFTTIVNSHLFSREMVETLRLIVLGGEEIRWEDVEKIHSLCGSTRIMNHYGPTETTIGSVAQYIDLNEFEAYKHNPTIGKPINNTKVFILDSHWRLQPIGAAGELCIGGDGVSQGYLNSPELTNSKFHIPEPQKKVPGKRIYTSYRSYKSYIYRTGDLAARQPRGNIMFLGRIDQQVKIRGYRVELGEIESQLLNHEKINGAVVITRGERDDRHLYAYIVPGEDLEEPEPREYLSARLPDYMIPSYFVQLQQFPLTPNGKVDRKALPIPELAAGPGYRAPANEIEKKLVNLWADVLRLEQETIGIDHGFFQLGGNSLRAIVLTAKIHKMFNIKVSLADLFDRSTIRGLSHLIKGAKEEQFVSIEPVEEKEYYRLSSAQKRLYILQQMDSANTAYNMPSILKLEDQPQVKKLQDSLAGLIKRHESLRTSFTVLEEEPVQEIHRHTTFKIEYFEQGSGNNIEEMVQKFVGPFDLSKAPLFGAGLIKLKEFGHILMVDMHHIVSDGISIVLIINELMTRYEGKDLPRLRLQYKDYSEWQHLVKEEAPLQRQEKYWLNEYRGELPVLNLPADYARPLLQDFSGSKVGFQIDKEKTAQLKNLAQKNDLTLYMLLLAILNILLSKLSSQENIVIGTPVAGRRHSDLESIVGMFVNTLALRNFPSGSKTFNQFLAEIRERTLQAFENQDYPFEELVENVSITRDTSRNPMFDVMFALERRGRPGIEIPGLKMKPYRYSNPISKFDLSFTGYEIEEILEFSLEYCTALFKKETSERLAEYFKIIINAVLENSNEKISGLEIIPPAEKARLLYEFNDTKAGYPSDMTIHELFEKQVVKTPDNAAVLFENHRFTYRELNARSNQLARVLKDRGIKIGAIVGIMVERSIEMIIGILAVLKAGSAYLPLDPDDPGTRKTYILEDSSAAALFTHKHLQKKNKNLLIIPTRSAVEMDRSNLNLNVSKNNLAYIIYTSGSTGRPKGVMIEHTSVINLVFSRLDAFHIQEKEHILQFSSTCFDASVEQIFLALFSGSVLVLIDKYVIGDKPGFEEFISRYSITHFDTVPSFCSHLDVKSTYNLKRVVCGGEACSSTLALKWGTDYEFYNAYGPTEAAVTSIAFHWTNDKAKWEQGQQIPIGKPIKNTTVYLLDSHLKPVPYGVKGELYLGGTGIARGYLNNPQLTAEKFISNPFINAANRDRLFRTGDLGKWLDDGNIEFLGRKDQQVKIRGFRVEPEEIENHLKKHNKIKEAVVIPAEDHQGDQYLCAYVVPGSDLEISELRNHLSNVLPGFMIPGFFVKLDKIPLTPGGKVARKKLPRPTVSIKEKYTAPGNKPEEKLAEIWSEVLHLEKNKIDIHANFFELGGHSLRAAMALVKIHNSLDIKIPLADFFKNPTISGLSQHIKNSNRHGFISIQSVEKKEYYRLSSAQRRLFIINRMQKQSLAYNDQQMAVLDGNIEKGKMERIFSKLIRKHESFRTSFEIIDSEPVQRVHQHDGLEFAIRYYERGNQGRTNGTWVKEIINHFVRPFDLSKAPLLRAAMVKLKNETHILMMDTHHIVDDHISSANIFLEDFMASWQGKEWPALRIQYKDYSEWQNSEKIKTLIKDQEKHWLKRFAGEIPVLYLPTDYKRPDFFNFEGSSVDFWLNKDELKALNELAKAERGTLFAVLLTVLNIFLSKLSGQEDIIIGTSMAGRRHAGLEQIIGMFVNNCALRNFPGKEKTFNEFLHEVIERTLADLENQEYPLDDLVSKIALTRDPGRNPLFDVMFVLNNEEHTRLELKGLKLKPYRYKKKSAQLDLKLRAMEIGDSLFLKFEYNTKLFKKETIEMFVKYFKEIVSSVIKDKHRKLEDIKISHALLSTKSRVQHDPGDFGFIKN